MNRIELNWISWTEYLGAAKGQKGSSFMVSGFVSSFSRNCWHHQVKASSSCWWRSQAKVKRQGWESAPPNQWPKFNKSKNRRMHSSFSNVVSKGVQVSQGGVNEWGENEAGELQVVWTLYLSAERLSVFYSVCVPSLTYSHKLWAVTEITRLKIQAAKTSFL